MVCVVSPVWAVLSAFRVLTVRTTLTAPTPPALAGVAAATWTDAGPGTAPTGAVWSRSALGAGADPVWELVSQVGWSGAGWTFTGWSALREGGQSEQFSVDGASGWHSVFANADRWGRRRVASGGWSAPYRLSHAALDWTLIGIWDWLVWDRFSVAPGAPFPCTFPAAVDMSVVRDMRMRIEHRSGTLLFGDLLFPPPPVGSFANAASSAYEAGVTFQAGIDTTGRRDLGFSWNALAVAETYENDAWVIRFAAKFSRGHSDGAGVARTLRLIRQNSWRRTVRIGLWYR